MQISTLDASANSTISHIQRGKRRTQPTNQHPLAKADRYISPQTNNVFLQGWVAREDGCTDEGAGQIGPNA